MPKVGVRPTKDQVREAIFSSIAQHIAGARVLDLFAGTGAVGLEAWSRGASEVCWVERDRRVMSVLEKNVSSLCDEAERPASCVLSDAIEFVRRKDKPPYSVIFADPPYDRFGEGDVLEKTLRAMGDGRILAPDGLFIYEQSADEEPVEWPGWSLLKDKKYGDTRVLMYATAPVVP